jgi:hypothetical protein
MYQKIPCIFYQLTNYWHVSKDSMYILPTNFLMLDIPPKNFAPHYVSIYTSCFLFLIYKTNTDIKF